MAATNIQKLADAGIIDVRSLSRDDGELISSLTEQEVTTLIQIATRVSPQDPTAVKIENLRTGKPRICVPL